MVEVCVAGVGSALEVVFDVRSNDLATGSMPSSSSENSYDGSTAFRENDCDVGAFFGGAMFLGSGKELVRPLSDEF